MSFWSGDEWVKVILPNVANVPLPVPLPDYTLLSLKMLEERGHKYVCKKEGVNAPFKNGGNVFWALGW